MIKKKDRIGNKLFLFFLAFSFVSGSAISSYLSTSLWTWVILSLMGAAGAFIFSFRIKGRLKPTLLLCMGAFFLLGGLRMNIQRAPIPQNLEATEHIVHIHRSQPTYSGRQKYFGYIKSENDHPGVILYSKDSLGLLIGSDYQINGFVSQVPAPLNPDEFNYKAYLSQKGIYYQAYLKAEKTTHLERCPDLLDYAVIVNHKIQKIFEANLSKNSHAVVDAMFLGDKSYLDANLKNNYVNSGTMHILAVSGLHVGILYYIILFLVTKGNTRRRLTLTQASIIIGCIWSYAIIAGLPTSVIRAGIMFTFLLVGKSLNKSNNTYNSISLAAIIILLIDPTEVFTVSFQLSFIAVLSIISLYPIIAKAWVPKNKIIDYCWQIVTVSIAAQLGVLGLSIFYFHTFPSYFLIANLFAIPLSGLVLILSITSLVCAPIPILSDILFWLLDKTVLILNSCLDIIAHLPGNSLDWLHLSTGLIVFMGGLILLFFQFLRTKKRSL